MKEKRLFQAKRSGIAAFAAIFLLVQAFSNFLFEIPAAKAGSYEQLASHAESLNIPSPDASVPDSDWQFVPPPPPDVASPMQTGEFTSDELNFWQYLQEETDIDICRQTLLDPNLCRDFNPVGGGFGRSLKKYPDGTLALVEKIKLNLALGRETQLLNIGGNVGYFNLGITGGVRLEGSSVVVTPLGKKEWYTEIMRLIKVWKTRTVIPFKASRIRKMRNGEIWKVPVVIWAGFSPKAGVGAGPVPVSLNVSFGMSGQHLPTLSLFRAGDKELRLRLRIDQAVMRFVGVGPNASITPVTVGLDKLDTVLTSKLDTLIRPFASGLKLPLVGENAQNAGILLGNFGASQLAREFRSYTYACFGISSHGTSGKKMMMEYIFDPTDDKQMAALVRIVKDGGFDMPRKLAQIASGWSLIPWRNNAEDVSKLEQTQREWLKKHPDIQPAYAGVSGYSKKGKGMDLHVPLIVNYNSSRGTRYEKIKSHKGNGVHVNQAFRNSNDNFIELPRFGKIFKHNKSRNAYIINSETESGSVSAPILVYQHLEGMTRRSNRANRSLLKKMDGIMRYAGVMGEGENPAASLPLDSLQPVSTNTALSGGFHLAQVAVDIICPNCTPRYRASMLNFSLAFNENAVRDIIAAPNELVVKAFANSLGTVSGELMRKVLSVSMIRKDGSISHTRRGLEKVIDLSVNAFRRHRILRRISDMCRTATLIIQDLAKIRTAPTWKEQAEAIARLTAGEGESRLRYADIL
ncbi:MAG: hypothetical protein ABIG11_05095, partial [bacterium]